MTAIHILPKGNRPTPHAHAFGPGATIPADHGYAFEHRIWRCTRCPLVKITVLPEGKREWRVGEGESFTGEAPECVPTIGDAT